MSNMVTTSKHSETKIQKFRSPDKKPWWIKVTASSDRSTLVNIICICHHRHLPMISYLGERWHLEVATGEYYMKGGTKIEAAAEGVSTVDHKHLGLRQMPPYDHRWRQLPRIWSAKCLHICAIKLHCWYLGCGQLHVQDLPGRDHIIIDTHQPDMHTAIRGHALLCVQLKAL